MWLVLSQPEGSDVDSWGLQNRTWIALTDQGLTRRTVGTNASPPTGTRALVLNCWLSATRKWQSEVTEALGVFSSPADLRVWIHFGRTNSQSFSAKAIKEAWTTLCTTRPSLGVLANARVTPYSMTSKTRWDRALQALARSVRSGDAPGAVSLLKECEEAWDTANGYYQVVQPLGRLVEAVFPFMLEMQLAGAPSAGEPAHAEQWKVALREFQQRCGALADRTLLEDSKETAARTEWLSAELSRAAGDASEAPDILGALEVVRSLQRCEQEKAGATREELAKLVDLSRAYRLLEQRLVS